MSLFFGTCGPLLDAIERDGGYAAKREPAALTGPEVEHQRLDELEARILNELPTVHTPVIHRFVPQLYIREIFMPAGTLLTSKIHLTTHPYVVLSGAARVVIPGQEGVLLTGGYVGITAAGTRRALFIEQDCRWLTCHPLSADEEERRAAGAGDEELLAMIEERIIGKRERADGRNVHAEYKERLAAAGLPGPNEGVKLLETP